jgi:hypothetical protein
MLRIELSNSNADGIRRISLKNSSCWLHTGGKLAELTETSRAASSSVTLQS